MEKALRNQRVSASLLIVAAGLMWPAALRSADRWEIETVDPGGRASFTSLKVDKSGNVDVAYIPELPSHPLKYAFWDRSVKRWFTMTVTGAASFCTLVLDSKQYPRISYADHGTGVGARVRYARWDGTSWTIVGVSPATDATVAYFTSIALDAHDNPFFSYYEYLAPGSVQAIRLRSIFLANEEWEVRVVDPTQGSGKFNSIAVDSKGNPHIAYSNVKYENSGLRYASWDGTAWKVDVIEGTRPGMPQPEPTFSTAMILDKQDNPHIAYTDVEKGLLKYATRRNGQWQVQVLDRIRPGYPDRNGIALDADGNPYISYYDEKAGQLNLIFRTGGRWMHETVDRNMSGYTSSIGIDKDTIWISYGDDSEKALKVAHRPIGPMVSSQVQTGARVADKE